MFLTCMGELIDFFPGVFSPPLLCSDEQIILEEELSSATASVLADVRKYIHPNFSVALHLYMDLPQ